MSKGYVYGEVEITDPAEYRNTALLLRPALLPLVVGMSFAVETQRCLKVAGT